MSYDLIQCTRTHTRGDGSQYCVHNWDVEVAGRVDGWGRDGFWGAIFFWTDCQRMSLEGDRQVYIVRLNPSIYGDMKTHVYSAPPSLVLVQLLKPFLLHFQDTL